MKPARDTTPPPNRSAKAILRGVVLSASALLLVALSSCNWMPGAPKKSAEWVPEQDDLDFGKLYTVNCIACHSDGTTVSAARPMNDPFYLAWVPRDVVHQVTLDGIDGTTMPSFGPSSDTGLTDKQLDAIVDGIFAWGKSETIEGELPPYAAEPGDPVAGKQAYDTFCASCHGPDGNGGENGGSIVNAAYLSLVSNQGLRTAVVTGRPDLGMPNYRELVEGKSMTDEEIADVVAWMISHRPDPDLLQPTASQSAGATASPTPTAAAQTAADPSPAPTGEQDDN